MQTHVTTALCYPEASHARNFCRLRATLLAMLTNQLQLQLWLLALTYTILAEPPEIPAFLLNEWRSQVLVGASFLN